MLHDKPDLAAVLVQRPSGRYTKECSADGCTRVYSCRGLCGMHYKRETRAGRVASHLLHREQEPIFWELVALDGECWAWLHVRDHKGYGVASVHGVRYMAHRYAYEQMVGGIPEGLVLDHLCRNRACVNPYHLEPVTTAENSRRGLTGYGLRATCKRGHDITDTLNVYVRPDGKGRDCRPCRDEASRRSRARKA